ncbi:class I SAM-dependent methyltransferase [candidate division WWE3 bacterium]|uniref:Class I SAM-dependent methyltransferase n=1 Tax=candidate division WWE3 bacterium TaxID=2053526 RepID=A0A955LGJ4_UNCKA|nr:class I SAM-dependent methyltransferase [candidate division WWE3 bacterium]
MQSQWLEQYADPKHRKMLFPNGPAAVGTIFLDFLAQNGELQTGKTLVDLGCGNGRNAFPLAKLGFNVMGVDGIPQAINDANEKNQSETLSEKLSFVLQDLAESTWNIESDQFDYAIDINTFSSLDRRTQRNYRNELKRILHTGSLYFLYTYTVKDEYYRQFVTNDTADDGQPGTKIVCADDQVTRILYSRDELVTFFSPTFELVYEEEKIRYGKMFDEYYKRNFQVLIFKNN